MAKLRFLPFVAVVPMVIVLAAGSLAQESNVAGIGESGATSGEVVLPIGGDLESSGEPILPEGEHTGETESHGTPHYPIIHPDRQDWSFAGPFGTYDPAQLQRGFKVYQEVCANCHSLTRVAFRNLGEEGGPLFTEGQVRTIAALYTISLGVDADGQPVSRPGIPSDRFPARFINEDAARAANGGALPPDLSLIAKARAATAGFPQFIFDIFLQYQEAGPDYIYALLTGYGHEVPDDITVAPGQHYNPYFLSGATLAMAQPLRDGSVDYDDDTPETLDQYARDVAAFLMWAAEPHLVERKEMGFRVIIFLVVFAGLLYAVKRHVWSKAH